MLLLESDISQLGGLVPRSVVTLLLVALFIAAWKAPGWVKEIGRFTHDVGRDGAGDHIQCTHVRDKCAGVCCPWQSRLSTSGSFSQRSVRMSLVMRTLQIL